MKKEKVLFVVHTEYHMLVAISLLCDIFGDQSKYDIWIVQAIEQHSKRFKFPKKLSSFQNITYQEIDYDERELKTNPLFQSFYTDLQRTSVSACIIFNKLSFISFATVQELANRKAKIILAPDGAAAYTRITWFTPRWSLTVYLNTLRFLWVNGIKKIYWFWPTLVYGKLKEIDEVWIQYPAHVDKRAGKKVRKIEVIESPCSIATAKDFFGFTSEAFGDCIFYTNQPFRDAGIYDFEIELLQTLRSRFPERRLVIKLHPSSDNDQIDRFNKIAHVTCLTTTLPAELLIADLKNSIVVSFWSTSLLVENKSCRYYWLYPLLEKRGLMLKKISLVNPTQHIQLVTEADQIR